MYFDTPIGIEADLYRTINHSLAKVDYFYRYTSNLPHLVNLINMQPAHITNGSVSR
jgi:hypothetical protein